MKFAKELDQDLVPEWRAKYLDYKTGKKKVKAVSRALRDVNQTPKTPGRQRPSNLFSSATFRSPLSNRLKSQGSPNNPLGERRFSGQKPLASLRNGEDTPKGSEAGQAHQDHKERASNQSQSSAVRAPERQPLREDEPEYLSPWESGGVTTYGSIVASPPSRTIPVGPPSLELPDPAIPPNEEAFPRHHRAWRQSHTSRNGFPPIRRTASIAGDAYEVGRTNTPSKHGISLLPKHRNIFRPKRTFSTPDGGPSLARPPILRRMFSLAGTESPQSPHVPLEVYKEFDFRQADFFTFLDKELAKIESFYKMKEIEASKRLIVLKQQLHEMRDRRIEEVVAAQRHKDRIKEEQARLQSKTTQYQGHGSNDVSEESSMSTAKWIRPIENVIGKGGPNFGRNTKALQKIISASDLPPHPTGDQVDDSQRDFVRRRANQDEVPYRSAKRKLKSALQEFYRGLELLKSFSLLNRTAFRKINKKYDKAVNARPTGRYMSEKINKAWFVQSEVLDGHIVAVEDLYARYFERGNHKIAVGKLRSKHSRDNDYTANVFRNGVFTSAGVVLGIQGVVYGSQHLSDPDASVQTNTSYLLQIYGGYFLGLLLFLLFCLDCGVWSRSKINYVFIFEFDTRHNLDWRELSEFPCFLLFLGGLILWLNFRQTGSSAMFLYWPVILVVLTVLILFFPGPILYHRSRRWWAYSNFRLLHAGLYPVEFRDFFLGDMYCSQTYAMGNLELFFCLYTRMWNNPDQCNSTHSRLLGFFSTLPGIWRALQCLRRYYDTQNAFPHLVNCGKYLFTISYYMTLSLYRIDKDANLKALFISCATINAVYCSIWDLAMDWSLGNPYAKHPFLRDVLGYKRPWVYYLAMVLDPILRFNWIFYAIYSNDLQHSALLSFLVSFSEICRRAMWTLFRVENEHCTNVGRFRASRDIPLPYEIPSPLASTLESSEANDTSFEDPSSSEQRHRLINSLPRRLEGISSSADLEAATTAHATPSSDPLRQRKPPSTPSTPRPYGIARVGTMMAQAHAQDFERRRRPVVEELGGKDGDRDDAEGSTDEDEDEQDNEQDVTDVEEIMQRHGRAPQAP